MTRELDRIPYSFARLLELFTPHPTFTVAEWRPRQKPVFWRWTGAAADYARYCPPDKVRWGPLGRARWQWMTRTLHVTVSGNSCRGWDEALLKLRQRVQWADEGGENLRWWTTADVDALEQAILLPAWRRLP